MGAKCTHLYDLFEHARRHNFGLRAPKNTLDLDDEGKGKQDTKK